MSHHQPLRLDDRTGPHSLGKFVAYLHYSTECLGQESETTGHQVALRQVEVGEKALKGGC